MNPFNTEDLPDDEDISVELKEAVKKLFVSGKKPEADELTQALVILKLNLALQAAMAAMALESIEPMPAVSRWAFKSLEELAFNTYDLRDNARRLLGDR